MKCVACGCCLVEASSQVLVLSVLFQSVEVWSVLETFQIGTDMEGMHGNRLIRLPHMLWIIEQCSARVQHSDVIQRRPVLLFCESGQMQGSEQRLRWCRMACGSWWPPWRGMRTR